MDLCEFPVNKQSFVIFIKLIPADLNFDAARQAYAGFGAEEIVCVKIKLNFKWVLLFKSINYSFLQKSIEKGSHVRIKIVGTRFDATDIVSPKASWSLVSFLIFCSSVFFLFRGLCSLRSVPSKTIIVEFNHNSGSIVHYLSFFFGKKKNFFFF